MEYFNKEIETMSREDMEKLQSERLVAEIKYVYANSPLYRQKMDEAGIKPEDIKSIRALGRMRSR